VEIFIWVITVLLALVMLFSGALKAFAGKSEKLLSNPRMGWAGDFSDAGIRSIGVVEILGALGLILPAVTGIAPVLVPIAAVGLALTMLGAIAVHVRRGDGASAVVAPLIFMVLAIVIAWARFGSYPL